MCTKNAKSFLSQKVVRGVLIFISLAVNQTPVYTVRPETEGGQVELIWVADDILRWLTYLSVETHTLKY